MSKRNDQDVRLDRYPTDHKANSSALTQLGMLMTRVSDGSVNVCDVLSGLNEINNLSKGSVQLNLARNITRSLLHVTRDLIHEKKQEESSQVIKDLYLQIMLARVKVASITQDDADIHLVGKLWGTFQTQFSRLDWNQRKFLIDCFQSSTALKVSFGIRFLGAEGAEEADPMFWFVSDEVRNEAMKHYTRILCYENDFGEGCYEDDNLEFTQRTRMLAKIIQTDVSDDYLRGNLYKLLFEQSLNCASNNASKQLMYFIRREKGSKFEALVFWMFTKFIDHYKIVDLAKVGVEFPHFADDMHNYVTCHRTVDHRETPFDDCFLSAVVKYYLQKYNFYDEDKEFHQNEFHDLIDIILYANVSESVKIELVDSLFDENWYLDFMSFNPVFEHYLPKSWMCRYGYKEKAISQDTEYYTSFYRVFECIDVAPSKEEAVEACITIAQNIADVDRHNSIQHISELLTKAYDLCVKMADSYEKVAFLCDIHELKQKHGLR